LKTWLDTEYCAESRTLLPKVPCLAIVSGGQTGVDRAALDVALELGLKCGGWCPRGRRAEDGPIPNRYPLHETPSPFYPVRTRRNVRDSDATLVLTRGLPDRGTKLTCALAERLEKPLFVVNLNEPARFDRIRKWLTKYRVHTLNVAGPRESSQPGIHAQAADILRQLLQPLLASRRA
jgi:Circularly permutated YpsA SLOG family